jgi:hypothetical protein
MKSKPIKLDRFLLSYKGNKYLETRKYWNVIDIDINNYDYIIEPFAGIFGFSRVVYEHNPDFKGKFILNDINTDLVDTLKQLKDDSDEVFKKCDELYELYKDKTDRDITNYLNNSNVGESIKKVFTGQFGGLYSAIKGQRKLINYKEKKEEYNKFFKKVELFNMDVNEFIKSIEDNKKYKNKKLLYYFDPPYFDSSNIDYHNNTNGDISNNILINIDNTKLYIDILNKFKKGDSHCLMVMNKLEVINYVFNKYIHSEYNKIYQNQKIRNGIKYKSQTTHIIYKNF